MKYSRTHTVEEEHLAAWLKYNQKLGLIDKQLNVDLTLQLHFEEWRDQANLWSLPKATIFAHLIIAVARVFNPFFGLLLKLVGKRAIERPPGAWAASALQVVLTRRAYEGVFVQLIADERDEHAQALAEGRTGRARWYAIRLNLLIGWTLVNWAGVAIVKNLTKLWKATG